MGAMVTRKLTMHLWRKSEVIENPTARGWIAYCPELDMEITGRTQAEALERMHRRWDREATQAKQSLDRVIRRLSARGWIVCSTPLVEWR